MDSDLDKVMDWVTLQLGKGMVPRLSDVVEFSRVNMGLRHIKRSAIARALRLHDAYMMTSSQQREPKRALKYRSIVAHSLGHLHCDILFMGLSRDYETPKTFQAGILLAVDVVSKYKYAIILRKDRSAVSMVRAFTTLLDQHRKQFENGHLIKSISFDRETTVTGKLVQQFFKQNNISFHAFSLTSSKAKLSENSIRYFRNALRRLMLMDPSQRWWHMVDQTIQFLNQQPIRVQHKTLTWRPADINSSNVKSYLADVYKADPTFYHTQFTVAPELVQFKFPLGTLVRVKKIYSSSNVLEKRSEISLDANIFKVTEHIAYLTRAKTLAAAYRCINTRTLEEEIFDQAELAETKPS